MKNYRPVSNLSFLSLRKLITVRFDFFVLYFIFVLDCRNWPHQAPTYFEPSGPSGHKVTTIYSQCANAPFPSLATSKIYSDLLADLQGSSWGTNCLPSLTWLQLLFHRSHRDQTKESLCSSLGSRPTLAQGPSAHVPLLFGTTFHYLSHDVSL